ncbi:MAG: monomethylamine:corrinoid methyltransferase [Gemmatimonadetes bacterium]|nr:monomethylamine:corrinoid methyltransferase [Gemmatimonadota bacterium]
MLSLLEVAERTQLGPRVQESTWDMGLFRRVSDLVREYDIRYPGDGALFNMDDGLVERAFRAAVELLADLGVYCITTGRVVRFTEGEILQAVRETPGRLVVGEGRDARVLTQKAIEGTEPLNLCPGHHAPFDEELAPLVVKNFAQIPRADFIEGFNFTAVDGREIFGLPLEAYAGRRQLSWMREGIRKAGRPGMAIVFYPISTRAAALLAPMDPDFGLRRTDGVLLSVLPDLKVEHDLLTAAMAYEEYGCFGISGSFGMAGGFFGGVEGAVLEGIAKPIAALLAYHDHVSYTGVEHVSSVSALRIPARSLNWARSLVNQALNAHTRIICLAWVIPTSGPGTESHLLEVAVRAIEATISGANLYAPRHSRAAMNAGQTPLEAEFMAEVSDATLRARLDRGRAAEVVGHLSEALAGREPEPGVPVQECYDLVNHRPLPDFQATYESVRDRLATLGLSFR